MFQDVSPRQGQTSFHSDPPSTSIRVRDYIARYPRLSELEVDDLINVYCSLTPIEVALLRSEETLGRNLEQFRADHRAALRVPFHQYASLVWIGLFGLIVCAFAVVMGS